MKKIMIFFLSMILSSCSTSRPQDRAFLESIGLISKPNNDNESGKNGTGTSIDKRKVYVIVSREGNVFCSLELSLRMSGGKVLSPTKFVNHKECEDSNEFRVSVQKEQIAKKDRRDAINKERQKNIKKFISQNQKFKNYEEPAINRKILIGMPEELLILAWGRPKSINKSVNATSANNQYVYENNYVYTENGLITSYQTSN